MLLPELDVTELGASLRFYTGVLEASKALDRAGPEILASGMRQCLHAKPDGTFPDAHVLPEVHFSP